ncbi:MAG: AMP-binding protein [Mycobacterium sp.]
MIPTRLTPDVIRQNSGPGLWEDNLIDGYLSEAAAHAPERAAVVDRGRSWSYGELDERVNRFASALRSRGIEHGEVVSWILPNWVEALIVHHAALRIGAISNPIMPIYRHAETRFILQQAHSKVVIVPQRFRGFDYVAMINDIFEDLPNLETVVVVGAGGRPATGWSVGFEVLLEEGRTDPIEPTGRNANDLALLLYTSGTTSDPKGVLHTHNTLDYENRSIIEFFGLTASDVVFMPSPVGHIIGVLYGMQLPFMLNVPVVLLDIWEPGEALGLLSAHSCTFVVAATPFLHGIVHHPNLPETDVSSLRIFACGGAGVPPELIRVATTALNCVVSRGYGSTECPTVTASNASDPPAKHATTDGRPIGSAAVRLSDKGELLVRGPEMFVGYLDGALDAEAFTDDGWFYTGDLARLDSDGYVEITGRDKDIIIRGGENISAKEVEDLLFEHPKIDDIGIVAFPDPILGERVCAVVVLDRGETVTLAEIADWLTARKIARQKLPERLIVIDELPRTASGKVQKFKLRDLARSRALTSTES